jgi:hypothetical protein
MSRVRTPDNIEIASLKKKQVALNDPMTPGGGTPWEDRGTNGTVGAFIKTCITSLHSVGKLTAQIRRPETKTDAMGFLIGCAVCWGLSALLHGLILYMHIRSDPDFDPTNFMIHWVISVLAAGAATWFLFAFYNIMYAKLVAQEKTQSALPKVLLYNVTAYAMGPSLLALIPLVGPPIAIVLIGVNVIVVGVKRLRLRFAAAMIDAMLPYVVVVVVGFVGYWVGNLILNQVVGPTIDEPEVTHSVANQ